MTDKAAPKAKKAKASDAPKVPGPKLITQAPGIGHNHTGEVNPEAVKLLNELLAFQLQKKSISKAERDVRNRLKYEFNILASSVAREVALRKLDADVRVQVETNHEDFKKLLGYQPQLDFVGGEVTASSAKAQPTEAELDARDPEPKRGPKHAAGFSVDEEGEEKAPAAGVITREG